MTDAALEPEGPLPREEVNASPGWVRPTLLVLFCAGLLIAIGVVFMQVIAARVPEQRATLEKLITDRTGLAVRFDNVHFAWNMEGTSAVFEHVELTDPVRGRVRVVAPELRVEFDAWDFLRHQRFSLGHVTLSSPDIEIIGDAESEPRSATARPGARPSDAAPRGVDEATLIRRYTAWAELMPVGRVEVEGARVHLMRRGDRAARHNFTLSQAIVTRGSQSFNAFGTLLLSQDIGQSLFISAKLENLGTDQVPGANISASAGAPGVSGELRLIARRVFLDKLPLLVAIGKPRPGASPVAHGRGTIDARLTLEGGRIHHGSWQASARELQMPAGTRFDHFTMQGRLKRAAGGFALDFNDLQITRGARLERAPKISAHLRTTAGTLQPTQITATAELLPFMAAELFAGLLAPRFEVPSVFEETGWSATAGELHDLRFDSLAGTLSARLQGGELLRAGDQTRLTHLDAGVELEGDQAMLTFDAADRAQWQIAAAPPRPFELSGVISTRGTGSYDFKQLRLQSAAASVVANGSWTPGKTSAKPLTLELADIDRALAADAWTLLAVEPPTPFADLQEGRVVTGNLSLVPATDPEHPVEWARSRGSLELAGLASAGTDLPRLAAAAGKLEFARGATRLRLSSGTLEDLQLSDVRLDWPKSGPARLRAQAQGDLASPLLRRALAAQGLDRLTGTVTLDAEARGETELRDPGSWRVTARIRDASLPLSSELPAVVAINGTARLAGGALRGLALEGKWLDGPVGIESRRATPEGVTSARVHGVADASALLELLDQPALAARLRGQLAWSGSLQRRDSAPDGAAGWQLSLTSDLNGLESRLPPPFDKPRARALPLTAELRFDTRGIEEFAITGARGNVRTRVQQGVTLTEFDLNGLAGELRSGSQTTDPRLTIDRLDLPRAPAVLAAAGWLSSADQRLVVHVAELRHAGQALGAIDASLIRQARGLEFSLESAEGAVHRLDASGACSTEERCRMQFTVDTRELPTLLADTKLPAEWPTQSLHAAGEIAWRGDQRDLLDSLTGQFELETQGREDSHQLMASAVLAGGQIELSNVLGVGPAPEQVFRGSGRVSLVARTYDLTADFEQLSLAASAVPTPARMRLSRAWASLRGSVSGRAPSETAPARRVQWHGSWD